MAKTKTGDKFANIAAISVTESAAGTTTYAKFNFPFSIMDKVGLIINRIEYWPGALQQLNTGNDSVTIGLIAASSVVDLSSQADPAILDTMRLVRLDIGAAASGLIVQQAIVKDFASLPGGGILCAPSPLNAAIQSSGAGGVMNAWLKIFYTYMEMTTDEYWELVESRRIISS